MEHKFYYFDHIHKNGQTTILLVKRVIKYTQRLPNHDKLFQQPDVTTREYSSP